MFNKKKLKELEDEIVFLKHRIVDLENPFKYKIGDILEYTENNIKIKGILVSMENSNRVQPVIGLPPEYRTFQRINYYTIFNTDNASKDIIEERKNMKGHIKKINK